MKKNVMLLVLLVLLLGSVGTAFAAPWNNPNGYWIEDVACEDGTYDVWVGNSNTEASFKYTGSVGVMKRLYIDFGSGYVVVWEIKGQGVFKNTTYCEWELDGLPFAGDVLIP